MKKEKDGRFEELIQSEQAKLKRYEQKREDYEQKIKTAKANIEKYTLLRNNSDYNALSNALEGKGVDINDVLLAIQTGDFLALQEKIEHIDKNTDNDN